MKLGGPVGGYSDPAGWIAALDAKGYGAAYCPVGPDADDATVAAYSAAARQAGVVIAEVGAWSNPLSRDATEREAALTRCRNGLALADRIGANCCVNIAGSLGAKWDGPDGGDLTDETFEAIVAMVRSIVDAVEPSRACYTLETMPWMYPDSPDCYLRLMEAIDREHFAVHFDPINLINCPWRYYHNAELIDEFLTKLGPHIKSVHLKDATMSDQFMVHLNECRPGLGTVDYQALLRGLDKLRPDLPVMMEHLPNDEEYDLAAEYIRGVAREAGVAV
jgi:sugar phosphate isomerase/epimerase